jgi:hypothetical protein
MKAHILVGKTINEIEVQGDREALLVDCGPSGTIRATTYGDCCSTTWIESVEEPALGFPALVLSVTDLAMPETGVHKHREYTDVVSYYGLKIVTDRGDIVVDFRNDSNGYYGGSLDWPTDRVS